jgi:hypothetical protein
MGRARDLANILSSSGNVALDSEMGLSLITPTSITNTGGSANISSTGAVSFTSASAISLNNVFSSTYDNYLILVNLDSTSSGQLINMRMRVSEIDNSSNNYYWAYGYASYAGTAALVNKNSVGLTSSFEVGYSGGNFGLNVYNPFRSFKTVFSKILGLNNDNDVHYGGGGNMSVTTSYTGFSFLMASGNITGTIKVYGYRN